MLLVDIDEESPMYPIGIGVPLRHIIKPGLIMWLLKNVGEENKDWSIHSIYFPEKQKNVAGIRFRKLEHEVLAKLVWANGQ